MKNNKVNQEKVRFHWIGYSIWTIGAWACPILWLGGFMTVVGLIHFFAGKCWKIEL